MLVKGSVSIGRAAKTIFFLLLFALVFLDGSTAYAQTQVRQHVADPSTYKSILNRFGSIDSLKNLDTIGEVLIDKTVETKGLDSFSISLSAVSSGKSVTEYTTKPQDVLFILDTSGSMETSDDGTRRYQAMVDAANSAIKKIFEANSNNRVCVVAYAGNDKIVTLMELGTYTPSWSGSYLATSVEGGRDTKYYISLVATRTDGTTKSSKVQVTGGTNIQAGILAGGAKLLNSSATSDGSRVPTIVLLSDGAPTFSLSGDWWNLTTSTDSQQGAGYQTDSGHGFLSILSAASIKKQVSDKYGTDCYFYTIGLGVDNLEDDEKDIALATLDPTQNLDAANDMSEAVIAAWNTYGSGKSVSVMVNSAATNKVTCTVAHPSNTSLDPDSIRYNDGYFSASNASDLNKAFDSIIESVIANQADSPIEGESFTMEDTTGLYTYISSDPVLTYNGSQYTFEKTESKDGVDYYQCTGYVTGNIASAGATVNLGNIKLHIERGEGLASRDTITVTVPKELLPLVEIKSSIDKDGSETVSGIVDATPITVSYDVSVRERVVESLSNPDEELANYISENTSGDGAVVFYASQWHFAKTRAALDTYNAVYTPDANNSTYFDGDGERVYNGADATKENNVTSTIAHSVATTVAEGTSQETYVSLGNNGIVSYALPASLKVTKTVEGIDTNQKFVFNVSFTQAQGLLGLAGIETAAEVECTLTIVDCDGNVTTVTLGSTGSFTLASGDTATITNIPAGVTYTVEEVAVDGFIPTVVGDATGSLEENETKTVAFTNTYAPETAEIELVLEKVLTGRDWSDEDEFKFELLLDDDVVSTVTARNDTKIVTFEGVEVSSAGTYEYVIQEASGSSEGVSYSKAKYKATVVVVDEVNDGIYTGSLLVESISYERLFSDEGYESSLMTDWVVFNNLYTPKPVTVTDVEVSKVLTGREWKNGEEATFELVAATEGAPMPESTTVTIDSNDGVANFGTMEFSQAGTWLYEVREVIPEDKAGGLVYDETVYTIQVDVAYDSATGLLSVAKTYSVDGESRDELAFVNRYEAETSSGVGFDIVKVLDGRSLEEGVFEFTLAADENAAAKLPSTTLHNAGAEEGADAKLMTNSGQSLGELLASIEFTQDDAGKTFVWTLSEVQSGKNGYTYDTTEHTIKISVVDDTNGNLSTSVEVDGTAVDGGASARIVFENSYDAETYPYVDIQAKKTLAGRDLVKDEFTFVLRDANGEIVATAKNDVDGKIDFEDMGFSLSDLKEMIGKSLATFEVVDGFDTYTIVYTLQEDGEGLSDRGVTAGTEACVVTVTIVDNGAGTLVPSVAYGDEESGDVPVFQNLYAPAPAEAEIAGAKALEAAEGLEPAGIAGRFTFTLTPLGGAPEPEVVETTNAADGTVSFGSVEFAEAGTYVYEVRESGEVPGVTNDLESAKKITITVVDDGEGHLVADVEDGALFTFTNTYSVGPAESSVTDQVQISKTLVGRDLAEGEFEFELVEGGEVVATATNAADGSVSFGAVAYTEPGVHVYEVREIEGGLPGVSYDGRTFAVTTTVSDAGDGTLSVVHECECGSIVFENTYTVDPTGGVELTVEKTLVGRDWTDGDAFEFVLEACDDDAPMPEEASATVAGGDGTATFGPIVFTEEGQYRYRVSEAAGGIAGIVYDDSSYFYVVDVTVDESTARLMASVDRVLDGEGNQVEKAAFENRYVAAATLGGEVDLDAVKILEGRALVANAFSFQLEADDNAAAKLGSMTLRNAGAADGAAAELVDASGTSLGDLFAAVEFDQGDADKTFVWTLSEVDDGLNGYSYDGAVHTIEVSVEDDGSGSLGLTVRVDGEEVEDGRAEIAFRNTYLAVADGEVVVHAVKTLEGRELAEGEFEFTMYDANDAAVSTASNAADGSVVFGGMSFSSDELRRMVADGTAEYVVSAGLSTYVVPLTIYESTDGFDERGLEAVVSGHEVRVVCVDDGEGSIFMYVDYDSWNEAYPEFLNRYEAAPAEADIAGAKALEAAEGLEPADIAGRFTFTLTPLGGAPEPEVVETTNAADGTVSFGSVEFTEAGTYVYEVRESGEVPGVTNDETVKTVTVEVVDDGEGSLRAEVKGGDVAFTFTNTYSVDSAESSVTDQIAVSKTLAGRDLAEGEFEFELVEGGEVVATATNAADGSVAFPALSYEVPGVHVYEVREVEGGLPGVSYDGRTFTVTTIVSDAGDGTLSVAHECECGSIVFENTYAPSPVTVADIQVKKVFEGRDWKDGDAATFVLAADASNPDAPMPADAQATVGENGGVATFAPVTYTEEGTYVYTMREVVPEDGAPGVTYDDSTYVVVVEVNHDLETATLSAKVGYMKAQAGDIELPVFTNRYESRADFSAATSVEAYKTLSGRDLEAGAFSFELTANDVAEGKLASRTLSNMAASEGERAVLVDAEGRTLGDLFAAVEFDQGDAGETFVWTLSEVDDGRAGYAYDGTVHEIAVAVTDDGAGELTLAVTVDGVSVGEAGAALVFENGYDAVADGGARVCATKTLTGRDLEAGEFSFVLKDAGGTVVAEASNAADGSIVFGEMDFSLSELKRMVADGTAVKRVVDGRDTYEIAYTIEERTDGLEALGVTPVVASCEVVVVCVDDGAGSISMRVEYGDAGAAVLENAYKAAETSVRLAGGKVLEAAEGLEPADIAGRFTFTVTPLGGAPEPQASTATNDAAGTIDFGEVTFTEAGTFVYEIRESGSVPGVVNDAGVKTVTVEVVDDGEGSLIAMTDPEGELFRFVNRYEASPVSSSVSETVSISKVLDGRALAAGEFAFELVEDGEVVATATNDADGSVAFGAVTYTEPGAHSYLVREVSGTAAGVTYDDAVYALTVTVTDDGAGSLVAKTESATGPIVFKNTYEASAATVVVRADKKLTGRDLEEGEFEFVLADADGNVVSRATNMLNGSVVFEPLFFSAAGTYAYTVFEVAGDAEGIVYDDSVFDVTVTVSEDWANAGFSCEVSYGADPLFVNVWVSPELPDDSEIVVPDDSDDSGDDSNGEEPGDDGNDGDEPSDDDADGDEPNEDDPDDPDDDVVTDEPNDDATDGPDDPDDDVDADEPNGDDFDGPGDDLDVDEPSGDDAGEEPGDGSTSIDAGDSDGGRTESDASDDVETPVRVVIDYVTSALPKLGDAGSVAGVIALVGAGLVCLDMRRRL